MSSGSSTELAKTPQTLLGEATSVYWDAILPEVHRVAGLLDRNPHATTRGSFTRIHWAWKFNDFPFPRLQEGTFTLGRLHDLDVPGNPLYQSAAVREWISWSFANWADQQRSNGAFDEAYPFEQCLAATAFTGFYVGQSFLEWEHRLDSELRDRLRDTFRRAGDWLCNNDETHGILSNHLAVAVAALAILAEICDEPRFRTRAEFFLDRILEHQSSEGWMREYDGADIGYGTHGFFYLACYWQRTECAKTLAALQRFAEFLRYCVHPDGTLGGEYSSRNTEFGYPAGFEILASVCPHSATLAAALRESVSNRQVCGVWSMDLFNLFPMLNNLLFAHAHRADVSEAAPLPWRDKPFRKLFPECGLWVVNETRNYTLIGLSKGGTVSVFDKVERRLVARHAGLLARGGKKTYCSQDYQLSPKIEWPDPAEAVLDVPWKQLSIPVFGPLLFLAFRGFNITLGRFPAVSRWLKQTLVKVLIQRKRRPEVQHRRRLRLQEEAVEIYDELALPAAWQVTAEPYFTSVHMGSSLYVDARSFVDAGTRVEFPTSRTLRLRGRLDRNGAHWEVIPG